VIASYPPDPLLTPSDLVAAVSTIERGEQVGRGAPRLNPANWLFFPVRADRGIIAAMGLARDDGLPPIVDEQLPLLNNLLDQVALALERARLEAESRGVEELRDRDRLRSALLSSVGHDLRTPLTAIIAAAAELRHGKTADEMLIATVRSEATKLERYITNLLDMARIESGAVKLKTELVDLVDAVASAVRDVRRSLDGHEVDVDVPADLPLVKADPQLLHHCLINLLDNAGRHSGEGSEIRIRGRLSDKDILLCVEDGGRGLPDLGRQSVDAVVALRGSDHKDGAGLGLTIVDAFAKAMGAEVSAANRTEGRGAVFTLRFPKALTVIPPSSSSGS
jgi:two-component system sensor histidine kinase KdpD